MRYPELKNHLGKLEISKYRYIEISPMTDPITDMFNRIKNAQAVLHPIVDVPFSNIKLKIAEILQGYGFISDFKKRGRKGRKILRVTLKYNSQNQGVISGFKRVSKPGQRIYKKAKELKKVRNGYGIAIISTTKGLLTDQEARKQRAGGEVMAEVW